MLVDTECTDSLVQGHELVDTSRFWSIDYLSKCIAED